ncbi:MAG: ribosome biogenesis GTPase Der [Holosporales bacterium]|jgi:GTP-binding protein|nr:ribosome biogenesis GTPase Der [Holosporales bacterium]
MANCIVSAEFRIALIGRTNVGKSTLFNRLTKSKKALTFNRPGTTRDAKEKEIDIFNKKAILIDLPGMFDVSELSDIISAKLDELIDLSNLILFVIDGIDGLVNHDKDIAALLRKRNRYVIVVVNKCEKKMAESVYFEAMELGFEKVCKVSAEHGLGINDLCEFISQCIPAAEGVKSDINNQSIKLAIIGRPNAGKSTLVNALLGKNKQLVADFAGLTRESSEFEFEFEGRQIILIDTPGVRRSSRIFDTLEKISVANSKKAYRNSDIVIFVIDATSLISGRIEKQDLNLISRIIMEGKSLIVTFNKYDKTPYDKDDLPEFIKRNFNKSLSQFKDVPFLFISATKKENLSKMLHLVIDSYDKQKLKIKTSELNQWLQIINQNDLMQTASTKFKLKYITQIGIHPPSFVIFVSNKNYIRKDHERFIINKLRQNFALTDIVIKVYFKN